MTNFGDERTLVAIFLELSRLKMEPKEIIKYLNQRFTTILNKITIRSRPTQNVLV
jgi:hypothetical protein